MAFTKKNLKDGMIVVLRNGWRRIVSNDYLLDGFFVSCSKLSVYENNLLDGDGNTNLDIVKVENPINGEVIWERPKYTNFEWLKENIKDMTAEEFTEFISCEKRMCPDIHNCADCKIKFLNTEHLKA